MPILTHRRGPGWRGGALVGPLALPMIDQTRPSNGIWGDLPVQSHQGAKRAGFELEFTGRVGGIVGFIGAASDGG